MKISAKQVNNKKDDEQLKIKAALDVYVKIGEEEIQQEKNKTNKR